MCVGCVCAEERDTGNRFQGINRRKKVDINNRAYLFLYERYVWNGDIHHSEFFEESDT